MPCSLTSAEAETCFDLQENLVNLSGHTRIDAIRAVAQLKPDKEPQRHVCLCAHLQEPRDRIGQILYLRRVELGLGGEHICARRSITATIPRSLHRFRRPPLAA